MGGWEGLRIQVSRHVTPLSSSLGTSTPRIKEEAASKIFSYLLSY